jgi:hypothetical protein
MRISNDFCAFFASAAVQPSLRRSPIIDSQALLKHPYMTNTDVVLIIDSSDEDDVAPTSIPVNTTQYSAIIIDSDAEEFEKNQRLEKIIMSNVKERTLSTNVNKLFQKDTRLTNFKRRNGTPKSSPTRPSGMSQFVQDRSEQLDSTIDEILNGTSSTQPSASSTQDRIAPRSRRESNQTPKPRVPSVKKPNEGETEIEEDLDYYISFVNDTRKRRLSEAETVRHILFYVL